jgi:putative hydrolase of the HAD superfamily
MSLSRTRGKERGLGPAHIPDFWLFDLDNTLYPADSQLFRQIDHRMGAYISQLLDVDSCEARRLQKSYYKRYGATLSGLIKNHSIDPDTYLEYVHDIDLSVINPAPRLNQILGALPGVKYVFTNGSVTHAENVMARLGISDRFHGIQDIKANCYIPKPDPSAYSAIVSRFGLLPASTIMLDDIPKNLLPAANLGIITVWVRNDRWVGYDAGDYISYMTTDLNNWLDGMLEN